MLLQKVAIVFRDRCLETFTNQETQKRLRTNKSIFREMVKLLTHNEQERLRKDNAIKRKQSNPKSTIE